MKLELPYTGGVWQRVLVCMWLLALLTSAAARQNSSEKSPPQALPPGVLVPDEKCAAKPGQSYALYLPSHYTPDKRWPIVYAFDPDARGEIAVALMKDAAERYGFIVLGSNNSRNGSWKLEAESAQAMWEDTHARLSIDDRRIYFAGFSGGARLASQLAQQCKCAAGVLLNGAGFAGVPPSANVRFAVFAAVGSFDFNYPELSALDEKLDQAGFPHVLRHFEGPHEWAPAEVIDEAFAWFKLIAVKQKKEVRDDSFIALQEAAAVARAQALEKSGQSYEAWREYRQAIATFDGLTDTAPLQQAAASLAQQKTVREGAKREAQEFQEQSRLTSQIYSGLAELRGSAVGSSDAADQTQQQTSELRGRSALAGAPSAPDNRSDIFHTVEQEVIDLRERVASEKHEDKLRVYRRALTGAFIAAGEFGDESLAAKDFAAAKDYFQIAVDANPDSEGALQELATARALANDRKGTLDALVRAKAKSNDSTAFVAWLNGESAFDKLRQDPQFRALLANP